MADDKISATGQYFYQSTPGASSPISTAVLNTLGQLLSGTNTLRSIVKSNATAITTQLGANSGFIDAVQPTGGAGNIPEAYLTILFFDERFNFISAADRGVVQKQVAASASEGGSTVCFWEEVGAVVRMKTMSEIIIIPKSAKAASNTASNALVDVGKIFW